MPSSPETQRRWRISLIRERSELRGFVQAPDEQTAIKEPTKRFEVDDEEKHKDVVTVRLLGFVDAPDEATAIKQAIERFAVRDEDSHKHLVAVKWK
jgi:hypothetical protein